MVYCISKMPPLHEDELLAIAAEALRSLGWTIFVSAANQCSRFRFKLPTGQWKAPDLVALRNPAVLVGEGKVRAADLVRGQDLEALEFLAGSTDAQSRLTSEVRRLLKPRGLPLPDEPQIVPAVIFSGGSPTSSAAILRRKFLTVLKISGSPLSMTVGQDPFELFKAPSVG